MPERPVRSAIPPLKSASIADDDIGLQYLGQIGSDLEEESDYLFGIITGLDADEKGNVFALDYRLRTVRTFDPNGVLVRTVELKEGQGPGEFQRPFSLSLAGDGRHQWISDRTASKITMMTRTGQFVTSFSKPLLHFQVHGALDNFVATSSAAFAVEHESPVVHLFDQQGDLQSSFGFRHADFGKWESKGWSGIDNTYLGTLSDGYALAFSYPYEILIFDKAGKPTHRFGKDESYFGDTYKAGNWNRVTGMLGGLVTGSGQLIIAVAHDLQKAQSYAHFYDRHGSFYGESNLNELTGTEWQAVTYGASVGDSLLYLTTNAPYPRILKFAIEKRPK